jgi:hypothetical protein
METADVHDWRADEHRRLAASAEQTAGPANYQCGDVDMSDQLTSGGQRMVPMVPCWDPAEEAAERHRVAALRLEHKAREERRAAADLVETELAACRGISPDEIDHSPFAHRRAIAEVIPHREGGEIRGVRIVFKPVTGLSAAWMERAIGCHRARFERLGEPAAYLADDPTLVPGATATVSVHSGHLEVGRARDLVATRTAGR